MITQHSKAKKHLVAVECLALGFNEDGLKVLLLKKKTSLEQVKWSLMSDFVNETEDLEETAKRIIKDHTGIHNSYFEQLGTYENRQNDPEGLVIAITYLAFVRVKDFKSCPEIQWVNLKTLPKLSTDFTFIVKAAQKKLQEASILRTAGTYLLNPHFSLLQLQMLYEAIHQKKIDKRNFHKWILSSGILKKTNSKDMSTSKKGTYLYEFSKIKNYLTKK